MKELIKELADKDTSAKKRLLDKLESRLTRELSSACQFFTDYAERRIYSHDLASIPPFLERMLFRTTPLIVIQPRTPEDLLKILEIAKEYGLPVFPRGIASWGLGGAVPTSNGIVVDFSPMDGMNTPDLEKQSITVQAGARWGLIDERLQGEGLQLAVTPSSRFSTVGGWIATGGYGLGSLAYGHLQKWVLEFKVATPAKGLVTLRPGDPDFPIFFNTEGQLGLIYEITLKLIPRHRKESAHLVYFDSPGSAFIFARKMLDQGIVPVSVNFKGANHMDELNGIWKEKLFEEKPSLLFAFQDEEHEQAYGQKIQGQNEAPAHIARLLWQERYNPLSMHSSAPSLLASEVILPIEKAPLYMEKAEALARNYKVTLFFEFHFITHEEGFRVLAMCLFNCDRRKRLYYYAYLSLVPALTRLGIKLGGKPYGIGIWNVPFFSAAFDRSLKDKIIQGKNTYDPGHLMNPRKFTSIRSRFHDIPAKIFHPIFFSLGMDFTMIFSPLLRAFLPVIKSQLHKGDSLMEESAFSCTGCGNCLIICPAYLVTRKEGTSPRGKLSLARRFIHGKKLSPGSVQEAFCCTRCKNCEHVCQSRIRHTAVWDELEDRLKKLNLHSGEKIREFIDSLPEHREYLDLIGIEKWVNL